jgi:putative transposase
MSQAPLRARLPELAAQRIAYGYRRLHVLLAREGWRVNHKRVQRLYNDEGLTLRRKRLKRHRSAVVREARPVPTAANERWAMDFVHDTLAAGRRIRIFTVLEVYTRECLAAEAAANLEGEDVAAELDRVVADRGAPAVIQSDNGGEFTGRMLDLWAYGRGVRLDFSRPGKPTDNPVIESFHRRLRQECPSQH